MDINRRQLLMTGAAAGATLAGSMFGAGQIKAAQAKAGKQVPGAFRIAIGDIEVTAILDGYIDLETNLFPGADPQEIERLQAENFAPVGSTVRASVNCFVVNTGEKLVIVDAGGRDLMGPTVGEMPDGLAAAGIDPAAVDMVLVTHMHPDHIGGITTKNGAAVFPNAELVVHNDEWDFWMSQELMAKATETAAAFIQAAQAAATPYAKRTRKITGDEKLVPGIRAVGLPGHTPGHTGFQISSGKESLLVWGDIVHSSILQCPHPDWAISFDILPAVAATTRRKLFEKSVNERTLIAGMHLPFPGIGHVVRDNEYSFVPMQWNYGL